MMSVFVDRTSNMAAIDLQPGRAIDRTDEVGASLLANYDDSGDLVSVEILSLRALQRPEVVAELHLLLGSLGEINEGTSFVGSPFLTIAPPRLNVVDLLIRQIRQSSVEDRGGREADVLT